MLISEADARSLLQPIQRHLDGALREAWTLWESVRALAPSFYNRPRDTMVNGAAAKELAARLGGRSDVTIFERHEQIIVGVKDAAGVVRVLVRVKKLNEGLQFSNYPTPRAKRMQNQDPLSGLPRAPIIVVGYQLDELKTMIAATWVMLKEGAHLHWAYRLDHAINGIVIQTPLFDPMAATAASANADDAPAFVVVPKLPKVEPSNDTGEGGSSPK